MPYQTGSTLKGFSQVFCVLNFIGSGLGLPFVRVDDWLLKSLQIPELNPTDLSDVPCYHFQNIFTSF